MKQYLTQGQIQLVVHADKPMEVKITSTYKFYTHNCSILLPYQHNGPSLLLPTKKDCLLNYDQTSSLQFLQNNVTLLLEIARNHTVADIVLEQNNESYTIITIAYPASPTYINKQQDKQTTSLQEKPGLNYDGNKAYHWNWSFGVFPDDADILDTY